MCFAVLKQNSNLAVLIIVWSCSEKVILWAGASFSWVFPVLKLPGSFPSSEPRDEVTLPCHAAVVDGLGCVLLECSGCCRTVLGSWGTVSPAGGVLASWSCPRDSWKVAVSSAGRLVPRPLLQNQPSVNSYLQPPPCHLVSKCLIKNVGFFCIFIKFWSQIEGRWVGGSKTCSVLWHVELLVGHILQLILAVTHVL